MNKRECAQLIAIIKTVFPKYLDGYNEQMMQGAVNIWMEFVGEMDRRLAYLAVKEFIHTADVLYRSDNVPLMIEEKVREIRNAIKAEFPLRKFRYKEVNEFVRTERKKQGKLIWAEMRTLPPAWERINDDTDRP